MGSCISSASFEIHAVDYGHENLVYYQDSNYTDEFQKLGSLFSHQGSKGLNQDAAILHQVWYYEQNSLWSLCFLYFSSKGFGIMVGSNLTGIWNGGWSFLWNF